MYRCITKDRIYIDDYAHHPEEIRAFLTSVRGLFPGKKLTGIFQPHLFSRTRDFADQFARSLEMLDVLILMEIYPAREEPIPGVSSALIFDLVNMKEKFMVSREQVMKVVMEQEPGLLVTMGAGDINQFVAPLKSWMEKMIGKAAKILIWMGIAAWFVVVMGFVSDESDEVLCNRIEVVLQDTVNNRFVTRSEVRSIVENSGLETQGYPLSRRSIPGSWNLYWRRIPISGMQR